MLSAGSGGSARLGLNAGVDLLSHRMEGARILVEERSAGEQNRGHDTDSDVVHEWCCHATVGIEEAFDYYRRSFICRFCNRRLLHYESKTHYVAERWREAGKHLVAKHNFGGCNSFLSYQSEAEFREHILGYHSMSVINEPFIQGHQIPRGQSRFRRGIEYDTQVLAGRDEAVKFELIYQASIDTFLADWDNETAFWRLEDSSTEDTQLWQMTRQLELKIACLEEQSIVSGHDFNCIRYFMKHLRLSRKEPARQNDQDTTNHDQTKGHLPTPHPTHEEATNTSIIPYQRYRASIRARLPISPPSKDTGALEKPPTPRNDKINSWLYDVLKHSRTTRILMRYATNTETPQVPGMQEWLDNVSEFWDKDEANAEVEQPGDKSDGAFDSLNTVETQIAL